MCPEITPDPGITLEELWKRARSRESAFKINKLLAGTRPIERRAGVIVVRLEDDIKGMLAPNRGVLEGVLARELGQSVRLEIAESKSDQSTEGSTADPAQPDGNNRDEIEQNELVSTTMDLFDAEIIEIKSNSSKDQPERSRR